jgi:myosin I
MNQSGCYDVPGMDDRQSFEETRTAMNMIGMTANDQADVFRAVAAILHIGNVQFNGEDRASVSNNDVAKIAARMLQVPAEQFMQVRPPMVPIPNPPPWGGRRRAPTPRRAAP